MKATRVELEVTVVSITRLAMAIGKINSWVKMNFRREMNFRYNVLSGQLAKMHIINQAFDNSWIKAKIREMDFTWQKPPVSWTKRKRILQTSRVHEHLKENQNKSAYFVLCPKETPKKRVLSYTHP